MNHFKHCYSKNYYERIKPKKSKPKKLNWVDKMGNMAVAYGIEINKPTTALAWELKFFYGKEINPADKKVVPEPRFNLKELPHGPSSYY